MRPVGCRTIWFVAAVTTPKRPEAEVHTPRVGFVLEQTLGHRSHAANLQRILPTLGRIEPVFRLVDFEPRRRYPRLPGYSNWTLRAAVRTARTLRDLCRRTQVDVLFFHTNVVATLAGRWMRRIPSVVSLDATPAQYDEMGSPYNHRVRHRLIEAAKHHVNRRCLGLAADVVAWSEWCRESLIEHYGVAPDKVTVIPPGVDVRRWTRIGDRQDDGVVRILFVGDDFQRKGGDVLVEAVRRLRRRVSERPATLAIELDIVSNADVRCEPGVHVHRGVSPNSPELVGLYHRASIFCLPTRGDCLPMVLSEAGAAGLPLVSTSVGAISEIVEDGRNGILVAPGDVDELVVALRRLASDAGLRATWGRRAEQVVAERFNAETNAARLADLLGALAAPAHRSGSSNRHTPAFQFDE